MPLTRSRAGFTLVELLIALTLLGIVGAVTVRLLSDTQRVTTAQGERAHMQATTRVGALVMPTELREINPAMGDITAMSDTSIEYRGMRNLAMLWTAQHGWNTPRDGHIREALAGQIIWDPEVRSTGQSAVGYQTVMPPTASATMALRFSF